MKKKSKNPIFYFILAALLFIPMYWLAQKQKEKELDVISRGNETIGTVIDRWMTYNINDAFPRSIRFEFEHNGERIVGHGSLNRWEYENAIIGMKYKVKYLPENPKKALIFIGSPIESEYVNIEKERERIFKTSNSARRNARPLDEIQHLIPCSDKVLPCSDKVLPCSHY